MKVVTRLILAVLLLAGNIFSLAGCGTLVDRTDKANYWVMIDGVQYNPGDPCSKFTEKFELMFDQATKEIQPNHGASASFYKKSNGGRLLTGLRNPDTATKPLDECIISAITIDKENAEKFTHHFIGGIKTKKSTTDDVRKVFGAPTHRTKKEKGAEPKLIWSYQCSVEDNVELFYAFGFDSKTEVLMECSIGLDKIR